MPIDINEYALPTWTKMRDRYPWVEDRNYNFANLTVNPRTPYNRYNGDDTGLGWKAPGYNPNHNSTRVERVTITRDVESVKPY
jgi:hypothetical protein